MGYRLHIANKEGNTMTRSYDVEIQYRDQEGKLVTTFEYVSAYNRTQAAKIMRERGYEVCSVNFAG